MIFAEGGRRRLAVWVVDGRKAVATEFGVGLTDWRTGIVWADAALISGSRPFAHAHSPSRASNRLRVARRSPESIRGAHGGHARQLPTN
jgi:hypothetical protein